MPTITLTISASAASELNDTFGVGYQATLPSGQPNPETKQQFARRHIIALLKQHVMLYRKRQAAAAIAATEPDIT
jgi:hypothetical protein